MSGDLNTSLMSLSRFPSMTSSFLSSLSLMRSFLASSLSLMKSLRSSLSLSLMKSLRPSLMSLMIDFPLGMAMFSSDRTLAIGLPTVFVPDPANSRATTAPVESTITEPESPLVGEQRVLRGVGGDAHLVGEDVDAQTVAVVDAHA